MRLVGYFLLVILLSIGITSALDIGFIVRSPGNLESGETAVVSFLVSEGHDVDILDDVPFDSNLFDLIVVGESVSDIHSIFDHTNKETLFMSRNAAKKKGLSSSSGVSSDRYGTIEKSEGITQGYNLGELQIYNSQDNLDYLSGCYPVNANGLVSKSNNGKLVLLALDTDALLIDNGCTDRDAELDSRNLFFGIVEADNWNDDSRELFRRSVDWLVGADINNPPVINSFSPENPVSVIENVNRIFSVSYSDPDGDSLDVEWRVDGVLRGSENEYIFNEDLGNYEVRVVISDGNDDVENSWDVSVVESSSLICSAIGGDICSDDEICNGSFLDSSDSERCCSVACVIDGPDFSKANLCEIINDDVEIDFLNLNDGKDYDIGDEINPTVRIRNNGDENQNYDVTGYFYDVTDDRVVQKDSKRVNINDGKSDLVGFDFDVDQDLDADNDYSILIVADDDVCNQESRDIDIIRKDNDLSINKVELDRDELICGDVFNMDVSVQNIGSKDQDVYIKVKSSKLKIDLESEGFELEQFDEEDSVKKRFNLRIGDNVKSGDYTIRAEVYYGNQREFFDKIVTLGLCGDEEFEEDSEDILLGESLVDIDGVVSLGEVVEDVQEEDLEANGGSSLFRNIFLVLLIIFAGVAGFIVYNFSHA